MYNVILNIIYYMIHNYNSISKYNVLHKFIIYDHLCK